MQSKWPNSVSIKVKNDNFDFIDVSSDHENYYSWNKNSIFSKIAQSVRGQSLHYCITHV